MTAESALATISNQSEFLHGFYDTWLSDLNTAIRQSGTARRDLAGALGMSYKSLQRRLRGEGHFPAVVFARLTEAFDLPGACTPSAYGHLRFDRITAAGAPHCNETYIAVLRRFADQLERLRGDSGELQAYVSTTDLPIFPIFGEPVLVALKAFLFEGGGAELDEDFDFERVVARHPTFMDGAREVYRAYEATDTTEIWGETPLRSLLRQVVNLSRQAALPHSEAPAVFAALRAVVARVRASAKTGRKPGGGALALHVHDLEARNTVVAIRGGRGCLTFHTLRNPNYVCSDQRATCEATIRDIEAIRDRGQMIGGAGNRSYRGFAKQMLSAVRHAEEQVSASAS